MSDSTTEKVKLNPKHWFWCEQCERRSYSRDCECYGSTCNGGGCDKCGPYFALARQAIKDGSAPSVEECKVNSLDRMDVKEEELLKRIFSE